MTIEELTFTAFQQGRERGREESAAQIEAYKHEAEVYREIKIEYEILLARSQREAAQIEELTDLLAVERVRSHMLSEDLAALQPKEDDQ